MEAFGMDSSGRAVPPGSKVSSHYAWHRLSRRAFTGGAATAAPRTRWAVGRCALPPHRQDRFPSCRPGRRPSRPPSAGQPVRCRAHLASTVSPTPEFAVVHGGPTWYPAPCHVTARILPGAPVCLEEDHEVSLDVIAPCRNRGRDPGARCDAVCIVACACCCIVACACCCHERQSHAHGLHQSRKSTVRRLGGSGL